MLRLLLNIFLVFSCSSLSLARASRSWNYYWLYELILKPDVLSGCFFWCYTTARLRYFLSICLNEGLKFFGIAIVVLGATAVGVG